MARVVHYVDPATPAELAYPLSPAQLAAKQQRDRALYARWKARQLAIAERDRKVRRFWLGFGAVIGLAVLLALGVAGWLLWTGLGLGVLAVPVLTAGPRHSPSAATNASPSCSTGTDGHRHHTDVPVPTANRRHRTSAVQSDSRCRQPSSTDPPPNGRSQRHARYPIAGLCLP